jgi:hypothetical protein
MPTIRKVYRTTAWAFNARTRAFLPNDQREQWLDRHAPWIDSSTREYILKLGAYWYSPRSLGEHLELSDDVREKCRAWSIEASGITKEQRKMINSEKNRKSQERRRRKNGAKPQAESERRTKPWEALNISESTYRRQKRRDSISSRPSLILSTNDELLSPGKPEATGTVPPHGPAIAASGTIVSTVSTKSAKVLSMADFLAQRKALAERLQHIRRTTGDTSNLRWAA